MTRLTLDRLQTLLQEDDDRQRRQNEEAANDQTTQIRRQRLQKSVRAIWQHVGVLPQSNDDDDTKNSLSGNRECWLWPIANSLYSSPLSAPQTTLVAWKSLPLPVQTKLLHSKKVDPDKVNGSNNERYPSPD
jgi:hypothetical protein